MMLQLISHKPLKILTIFIPLTQVDPVYTNGSCEQTLHNVKHAQYHHHYQAYWSDHLYLKYLASPIYQTGNFERVSSQ